MNLSFLSKNESENIRKLLNLSSEEDRIFTLLTKNFSIIKISEEMNMSTRTVDRRIKNIKIKMGRL